MLGALAEVDRLPTVIPTAFLVLVLLLFVARPLAVIVSLALLLVQTPIPAPLGRRLGVVLSDEVVELEVEAAPLDDMHALVLGIEVPAGSGFVGTFIVEIGLPPGSVVALVVRCKAAIAPDVNTRIRAGDQLLVVTTEDARTATDKRLREVARGGRLARWLSPPTGEQRLG